MNEYPCVNDCGVNPFPNAALRDLHQHDHCSKRFGDDQSTEGTGESSTSTPNVKVRETLDAETHQQFLHPKPVKGLYIEAPVRAKIERVIKASEQTGEPQNLLFIGPSGCAKTTLAFHIAGVLNRPLAKINMQMITEASQLYGYREANAVEGTRYVLGQFPIAATTEGCIVLLDDVAHVHDRTITNGLLPALDPTRVVWIDYLGEYLKVASKVIFIGTGNQGHQYGGATKLDRAIVSRFDSRIYMGHPPEDVVVDILTERTGVQANDAERLARFAKMLRDSRTPVEVDMRGLLAAAKDMAYGASYFEAVTYTLLGDLDEQKMEDLKFKISDGMTEAENEKIGRGVRWEEWR